MGVEKSLTSSNKAKRIVTKFNAAVQWERTDRNRYLLEMKRISDSPDDIGIVKYYAGFNEALHYAQETKLFLADKKIRSVCDELGEVEGAEIVGSELFNLMGKCMGLLGKVMLLRKNSHGTKLIEEAALKYGNKSAMRNYANFFAYGKYGFPQDVDKAIEMTQKAIQLGNEHSKTDLLTYAILKTDA